MKAVNFDFYQPASVEEAVDRLSDRTIFTKILSGGQSLCPMMNFRLVRPDLVVDISRIETLQKINPIGDGIRIGSGVTHSRLEDGEVNGKTGAYLRKVASGIAYRAVRTRGTMGGSVAHADPSADWPAALLAVGAQMEVIGPNGTRTISAGEFVLGPYTTALDDDELLVAIHLPKLSKRARWSYVKQSRKPGEFAQAIAVFVEDEILGIKRTVVGANHMCPVVIEAIWDGEDVPSMGSLLSGLNGYDYKVHLAALRKAEKGLRDGLC